MPVRDLAIKGYTKLRGRGFGAKLKEGPLHALPSGYYNRKKRYASTHDDCHPPCTELRILLHLVYTHAVGGCTGTSLPFFSLFHVSFGR